MNALALSTFLLPTATTAAPELYVIELLSSTIVIAVIDNKYLRCPSCSHKAASRKGYADRRQEAGHAVQNGAPVLFLVRLMPRAFFLAMLAAPKMPMPKVESVIVPSPLKLAAALYLVTGNSNCSFS